MAVGGEIFPEFFWATGFNGDTSIPMDWMTSTAFAFRGGQA